MATTYEPIATTTASGSTVTISFSSIPSTYTDLVIVGDFTVAANSSIGLQFNGDTATNYSDTRITGSGTAAASARDTTVDRTYISFGDPTNKTNFIFNLMNYNNTTTYKTCLTRWNTPAAGTAAYVGLWRSTAAVSSIVIISASNFASGSTFTLYGIKAA